MNFLLHFMVMPFRVYIYFAGSINGVCSHARDDIQNFLRPTATQVREMRCLCARTNLVAWVGIVYDYAEFIQYRFIIHQKDRYNHAFDYIQYLYLCLNLIYTKI